VSFFKIFGKGTKEKEIELESFFQKKINKRSKQMK